MRAHLQIVLSTKLCAFIAYSYCSQRTGHFSRFTLYPSNPNGNRKVPRIDWHVYIAARGNTDSKAMDEFELVTYNYSFFHLIFALASMYIAMLMTGWGTGAEERDLIDVGWTSVWVKVVAQWATVALYAWTMTAPLLFPDRDFS